jgi:two-component system phosphate regulon sensor histidine kinase PhoR
MINDFLIFSKLESGTMPIIRERFQITDTFATALQTVSFHIESKHIELIKEFQDKLPDIYGSPSLISRVFQNLLSNAVKFNKDNGRVIIKIKREDNFVVTSIEDTGKGISEKSLPHIFDLYFRDSVESKTEGSGLGLTVVKSILQAHNGNISVKSHIGVGSIFTFKLPISNQ